MRKIRSGREEERLMDAQYEEIKRVCGAQAADDANLGWGIDDYTVSSKVYGFGVITSYFRGTQVVHEHDLDEDED